MGLIHSQNTLILFGGLGKVLKNRKFLTLDLQGKEILKGELPIGGFFTGKSFVYSDGSYIFPISEDYLLEYSNCFKLVAIG